MQALLFYYILATPKYFGTKYAFYNGFGQIIIFSQILMFYTFQHSRKMLLSSTTTLCRFFALVTLVRIVDTTKHVIHILIITQV